MAAPPSGPPARRFADLRTRIISGFAASAVALVLVWLGGVWAMGLIALATGAMIWEFRSITLNGGAAQGGSGAATFLLSGVVGGVAVAELWSVPGGFAWLAWSLAAAAVADLVAGRHRALGWGLAGGAYIGVAGIGFLYLRAMEPHGFLIVFWVCLVVVAADVGGYFAGQLIGGPKLWPRVSPKKTWAGVGGGVALAILLGVAFSWATTGTHLVQVCAVSVAVAVLSQGGDLAESALKRHFEIKDSGRLLPGHGGALDRFDGLAAAVLAVTLITWWRGTTVFIW